MALGQYILTKTASGMTWTQAKALAESMGGQLASLSSADENDAILQVLNGLGYGFLKADPSHSGQSLGPWIGLTQPAGSAEPGGGWTWLDGSPLTTAAWHPTQPDNYANDNVACFFRYQDKIGWCDVVDDLATIGYPRINSAIVEFSTAQAVLTGGADTDFILGGNIANTINGGDGIDYLSGGGGNDTLDGGAGVDDALFSGAYASHTITRLGNGSWTVAAGGETDTITNFEFLYFYATPTSYSYSLMEYIDRDAPNVNAAISDQSVAEESPWIFTVPASTFKGHDPSKFVYSASLADGSALPSWLSFDAATRTFSGAPPRDFNGAVDLKVTATEFYGAYLAGFDTFRLTVTPTNDAPVVAGAVALSPAVAEDGSRVIAVSELVARASDIDGDALSVSGFSASSGRLTDNGNGTFVFNPAADDSTAVTFTYTVSDGQGGTASASATLDITPVNDAPRASAVALAPTVEDAIRVISAAELLAGASDVDGDTLTVGGVSASSGRLTDNGNGTYTFRPKAHDDTAVTFAYTVADGQGGATAATASMDIAPRNDAPVITSGKGGAKASYALAENKKTVAALKAADVDGDTLAWSLGGKDAKLFTLGKTGVLAFKAAPDFEAPRDAGGNNVYDVTVKASDGRFADSQALSIRVTDVKGISKSGNGNPNTLTGGAEADTLKGLGRDDRLIGGGGNDKLYGGAANDRLRGDKGADHLWGGDGKTGMGLDTFVFAKLSDSTVGKAGQDTIYDFARGDKFDLSGIDANPRLAKDQAFTWIGDKAFSGKAGEVRFEKGRSDTTIYVNVDTTKPAQAKADFGFHLDDAVTLVKADFLL